MGRRAAEGRPLLAITDLAGSQWPERGRRVQRASKSADLGWSPEQSQLTSRRLREGSGWPGSSKSVDCATSL